MTDTATETASPDVRTLRRRIADHAQPSWGIALRQLVDSLLPFLGLLTLAFAVWPQIGFWSLGLAALAGLMAVRVFIMFHDCTHYAWVPGRRANRWIGRCLGVLVFTPYDMWRNEHGLHHAGSGHLDRRGHGDIETLTVDEYRARGFLGRLAYRLYRNPLVMFGLGPIWVFLFKQRFARRGAPWSERLNGWATNAALAVILAVLVLTQGWVPTLGIVLVMLATGMAVGVWLFYVQHQYEDAYWRQRGGWTASAAALQGSSFYDLPRPLRWLTGNIGYHHIHHLDARVPNYRLRKCHEALPPLPEVAVLTLRSSLDSLRLRLWDEDAGRMVGWRALRESSGRESAGTGRAHAAPDRAASRPSATGRGTDRGRAESRAASEPDAGRHAG